MQISALHLGNFRNFKEKKLDFENLMTIIVGSNAVGKTNILEAINLLATGRSFKARREDEMVQEGEEVGRANGIIDTDTDKDKDALEIVIVKNNSSGNKKRFFVNGVAKRLYNFAGILKVVLFGPWDMELVTESPSLRRRFLDSVLVQTDREYTRSLLSYEKGLRQRNKLLERIRDSEVSRSQLLFWDQLLIKNGEYLTSKREEFIEFVNNTPALNDQSFSLEYDKSIISPMRLEKYANEEVAAAKTLVGPHRDDMKFTTYDKRQTTSDKRDLAIFGSRGEQRMGVLWLKLAELSFIEEKTKVRPVLLLDDIFSELDHKHRDVVISIVGKQQTIITTADPHTIEGFENMQVIQLMNSY
ncbi:MAG: replication and repair protein RecF protein [Microgenomates group bacterium GW2011_GWA2_39_19]|uniref:DNA replication and repair protein RecF n=1 Tax=Candidatus Blackburnbacteria bacterium RIFCSPLOWO2_01_FULL_40_20 TaxID=1797519 RepID=A0A1G1VB79_9BACT|nr:MAG: replication and repair protein RecF protein [Microgenomates group bacterium GW2011_GWA2_39_19]OGY12492.1 MAG: hypothetical protein A3A77_00765 [Candidatus Blackburnbacteria bacterium RIFCSPLOWO2_01_FULL_40_20]HBL52126.1 hypothetical protein [Candidatus Blackburnbacteria bacterium]